jgi:hypothetical protein
MLHREGYQISSITLRRLRQQLGLRLRVVDLRMENSTYPTSPYACGLKYHVFRH